MYIDISGARPFWMPHSWLQSNTNSMLRAQSAMWTTCQSHVCVCVMYSKKYPTSLLWFTFESRPDSNGFQKRSQCQCVKFKLNEFEWLSYCMWFFDIVLVCVCVCVCIAIKNLYLEMQFVCQYVFVDAWKPKKRKSIEKKNEKKVYDYFFLLLFLDGKFMVIVIVFIFMLLVLFCRWFLLLLLFSFE